MNRVFFKLILFMALFLLFPFQKRYWDPRMFPPCGCYSTNLTCQFLYLPVLFHFLHLSLFTCHFMYRPFNSIHTFKSPLNQYCMCYNTRTLVFWTNQFPISATTRQHSIILFLRSTSNRNVVWLYKEYRVRDPTADA